VPDELPRKNYTVKATDGIHMNQINVMLNNYAESNTPSSSLGVIVDGQKQVRRGTTHTISVEV
ncbi:MAG: hypothetical protein GWN01_04600, partial [Nitrosopumilaceae archaeon]|nr:hypothetical protein [Nitrosopumilaceae archaeon]NIU86637.1 hypothetical protein [Nitrosopumilaceae archaeon]NIV66391.1 hypothetical protein [Nitrosopumilaceae archaeon]NIX60827.1 hypothetical protein [Nitrosopumilaceae archaeon]